MPDTLTVTLPYPPTANTYYRAYQGSILLSRKGQAYKRTVWALWVAAGMPRLKGKVGVWAQVFCPDQKLRDIDNLCKPLMDSIKNRYIGDDNDVDELHLIRCEVRRGGLLVVTLRELI